MSKKRSLLLKYRNLILIGALIFAGCGGSSGLGEESDSTGDGDDAALGIQSPNVTISSGDGDGGITVEINIDGNNQGGIAGGSEGDGNGGVVGQDQDNSVTTTTTIVNEGMSSEEDRVIACGKCVDKLEEPDECSCLSQLGCSAEDLSEDQLDDLLSCQANPGATFG